MTKRERELAEARVTIAHMEKDLRTAKSALDLAEDTLKWARKTLVEKEEENRKLKFIIMELTSGGSADGSTL